MENFKNGFNKIAGKVNYLDLYGLRRGASKVVKDLKPKSKVSTRATTSGAQLSKHTQQALKGTNVGSMSKEKWNKIMGLD